MSNIFDIKRFGKFLTYELNNAKASCGLSILVMCLLPAILFTFFEIFSFIFTRQFQPLNMEVKKICFTFCILILVMSIPAKMYGMLTEKKKGSDWLMIPASTFEKFLSMVLIMCVVLPVCFLALSGCCDWLLSVVFPEHYGASQTLEFFRRMSLFGDFGNDSMGLIEPSMGGVIWILFGSLCANILAFTLGAICFKRGKAGKTILCYFALSILLSTILVIFFGHGGSFDSDDFEKLMSGMTAQKAQHLINFVINSAFFVILGGLLTAIYFRIKTIKH